MAEAPTTGQSGGVNIHGGTVNTGGGDIVGHDKVVNQPSLRELEETFKPLAQIIAALPEGRRAEALTKLDEIKIEAAKGRQRDDGVLAKLIDGFVALVPASVSAVATAFGSPILSGVAGPFTKFVLDKIQGK